MNDPFDSPVSATAIDPLSVDRLSHLVDSTITAIQDRGKQLQSGLTAKFDSPPAAAAAAISTIGNRISNTILQQSQKATTAANGIANSLSDRMSIPVDEAVIRVALSQSPQISSIAGRIPSHCDDPLYRDDPECGPGGPYPPVCPLTPNNPTGRNLSGGTQTGQLFMGERSAGPSTGMPTDPIVPICDTLPGSGGSCPDCASMLAKHHLPADFSCPPPGWYSWGTCGRTIDGKYCLFFHDGDWCCPSTGECSDGKKPPPPPPIGKCPDCPPCNVPIPPIGDCCGAIVQVLQNGNATATAIASVLVQITNILSQTQSQNQQQDQQQQQQQDQQQQQQQGQSQSVTIQEGKEGQVTVTCNSQPPKVEFPDFATMRFREQDTQWVQDYERFMGQELADLYRSTTPQEMRDNLITILDNSNHGRPQ
jgi:uncharacterized protein YxeA